MTGDEKVITQMESELDRLLGWVRSAESRLALILPLATAMLGALAILAPAVSKWTVIGSIVVTLAVLFLLLSIVFAACASFPRTKGPKGSLIYFGGIITKELSQYEAAVKSRSPEAYINDLVSQCHRNAQIADRKYTWVQRSMACLFVSALPWIVAIFILYSEKL